MPNWQIDGIREEVVVAAQKYINGYYEGDIVKEERQGKGTYYWNSGNKYQGDWVNGDMHGYGVYYYANGCRYAGDFRFNDREGRGVFTFTDGSYYDGDFRYDAMFGEGVYRYADGASYKGHIEYGIFTGYGIYHWTNGDWYEGQWAKGLIHGRGTYHFGDGSWVNGLFENNKLISSARFSQEKSANVAVKTNDQQSATVGATAGVVGGAVVTGVAVAGKKTRDSVDYKLVPQETPQKACINHDSVQSTGNATNRNGDIAAPNGNGEPSSARNVIVLPQDEIAPRAGAGLTVAEYGASQSANRAVAMSKDGMRQTWWSSHLVRDYVSRDRGLEAVTDGSDAVYRHSKAKRDSVLTESQADFSNRMLNLEPLPQDIRYNAAAYGARTATQQRRADVVINTQPKTGAVGGNDLSKLPYSSNTPSKRRLAKEAKKQAKQLEKQAKRSKNAEVLYQADVEQYISLDSVNSIGGRSIKREQRAAQNISDSVTPSAFSIKRASMSAEDAILLNSAAVNGKVASFGAGTTVRKTNSVATPNYKRAVKPVAKSERAEIELVQTKVSSKKKKNKKNQRTPKKVAIYGRGSSPMQKEKLSNFLADYIDD